MFAARGNLKPCCVVGDAAGSTVTISFAAFSTEACCDSLTILDGNSPTSPQLEVLGGTLTNPASYDVTSTGGMPN